MSGQHKMKSKEESTIMPPSISEALERPPSDFCLWIIDYRRKHKLKVTKELFVYVKLFEDTLELLSQSITAMNYIEKEDWKTHLGFELVFLSTLPKTLFSAFDQILSGDYSEGMATCRIAYETILRICFLEVYPECHDSTIVRMKGKTIFQATNFLKDNLKVIDKDPLYEFLSFPVHSNTYNVLKTIVEGHKKGGVPITLGFEYSQEDLNLSFNHLMGIMYIAIRILSGLFNVHLVKIGHEIQEQKAYNDLMNDMPGRFKALPDLVDRILMEIEKRKTAYKKGDTAVL